MFWKIQVTARVSQTRLVQQANGEYMRGTEGMVPPPYRLVCKETTSELSVACRVRLVALVEVVSIRDIVLAAKPMIQAAHAVPEVGRPGDRDSYGSRFDSFAIDRCDVLNVLIIRYKRINIGQECQRR